MGTLSLGFDPALYLVANPDVARTGVDAAAHYLSVGHKDHWHQKGISLHLKAPVLTRFRWLRTQREGAALASTSTALIHRDSSSRQAIYGHSSRAALPCSSME
jgi:hypothetical protein